jgi:predicted phosphoribosyltransferase
MLHEMARLRDRRHVFRDRTHAGEVLAGMLEGHVPAAARVLAIPAGGVPVGAALAEALGAPLDVAVVSKVTPSRNSEVGYGAVAFDGSVRVDDRRRRQLSVSEAEAEADVARTVARVRRRVELLRPGGGPIVEPGEAAVLVDDGLASGTTMELAVEAIRKAGAARVAVAVPTGSGLAAARLATIADELFCANVRTGPFFAVADAYERWSDETEDAVLAILRRHRRSHPR